MESIKAVLTGDGTVTAYHPETGEHYHNKWGAATETQQHYILRTPFQQILEQQDTITLLDPFFGLGYLSAVSLLYLNQLPLQPHQRVQIIAFEMDPQILQLVPTTLKQFENQAPTLLNNLEEAFAHKIYYQTQGPATGISETPYIDWDWDQFNLKLYIGDTRQLIQKLKLPLFDAIYQDPFSPNKHPHLWTKQLFEQYQRHLHPQHGAIYTYTQSSPVRTALKQLGFNVYQSLAGEGMGINLKPGTIASLTPRNDLYALPEKALALMGCKAGIPFEDNNDLTLDIESVIKLREKHQTESNLSSSSSIHKLYPKIDRLNYFN